MVFSGINYRETYFEFPELTKVRGEPTSESLFKLRNELKANAKKKKASTPISAMKTMDIWRSFSVTLSTHCSPPYPSSDLSSQVHLLFLLSQLAPWPL
jgi:hypothetical protein